MSAPRQPASGQIACTIPSTLLRHVRLTLGHAAVEELIRRAGVPYDASHLEDVNNWIWYREGIALLEAAVELTGDADVARRVGEEVVRQHVGTPVATLLRDLGSPQSVFEQVAVVAAKFSTVTVMEPTEAAPGRVVVEARARDGFRRHALLCDWTKGMLSAPPVLFGLPPARVEHPECETRGDECCRYVITWDAERAAQAADPRELVVSLESQLAAMRERLDSVYATARDLIALDDLDAALQRITDRAATAVRAPRYLLVVRGDDGRLRVHHRGLSDAEAQAEARALLDADERALASAPDRIVADVASRTRRYGRIMAASPGASFFAAERDLLDVYARYAAAVLDSFTALARARRREAQARALLELAQALATAATRDDVAQRLADAVPAVVDCDRVVVYLWDEEEQVLACHAVSGEPSDDVRGLRVRTADTPMLRRIFARRSRDPVLHTRDDGDPFVSQVLRSTGAEACVLVPIVGHDRVYGLLSVVALHDASRLAVTFDLRERLIGVVAQAATAFENARLIETIAHQARHDNLTGLLGHRAFHEALRELLAAPGGSPFSLAAVDIDDFKLVNDVHGHPVGDEALRLVADALRQSVRGGDTVFRIGGEEFAVLLPGLRANDAAAVAERLRAAVARCEFRLPLRVSMGVACWPDDAPDGRALVERADAALYAAKRAGKNRVVLAADAGAHVDYAAAPVRRDLLHVLAERDPERVAHGARLATLAVAVGQALGLDGARLADLRTAAHLHGWGLARSAEIVRRHQAGAGGPADPPDDTVGLEARILRVVDAFAALIAGAADGGPALAAEAALQRLRGRAGAGLDAAVVEALGLAAADGPGSLVEAA